MPKGKLEPFVLLDGGQSGAIELFRHPFDVVSARRVEEVHIWLDKIADRGGHWAGYLAYEAGFAFEQRLREKGGGGDDDCDPLLWFGSFPPPTVLTSEELESWLSSTSGLSCALSTMEPACSYDDYEAAFGKISEAIRAGDIYQANLTFLLIGSWRGCPIALYRHIRAAAGARHGALIYTGNRWILSFSPELFFETAEGHIFARPMKGTAPRGCSAREDAELAHNLVTNVKDRAENLMIVDLLRNDLARIARPGSVRVDRLFAIETYPTVHQMVSDITGELMGRANVAQLVAALFPCGSITGAPKIRAMELIHDVEHRRRGIYCGSIGQITPTGDVKLNVAIRTLELNAEHGTAKMGVGSAVVADSSPFGEWQECLLKAAFLTKAAPKVELQ